MNRLIRFAVVGALLMFADSRLMRAQTSSTITRLRPSAFPQLPSAVRKGLEQRGCTIPQTYFGDKPHNVIAGAFIRHDSKDWAVLCSRGGVSTILVFRDGLTAKVDSLEARPDAGARKIISARKDFIVEHAQAYNGPKPPPIDHLGIDDGFIEKGSTVLYYYRGSWLRLQGAN